MDRVWMKRPPNSSADGATWLSKKSNFSRLFWLLCFALSALFCSGLLCSALSVRPQNRSLRPGPPARSGATAPAAPGPPCPAPLSCLFARRKRAAACPVQNRVTLRGNLGDMGGFHKVWRVRVQTAASLIIFL